MVLHRRWDRLAIGLVFLLAAACTAGGTGPSATPVGGGGDGPTAAGSAPATGGGTASNPCSLLTQAEVAGVLGKPVGPGDNSTDSHECAFQYPPDGIPEAQASITIETASSIEDLCTAGNGITVTKLSGIGDGACFDSVPGLTSGDNLTFSHAGQVFTVAASFGSTGSEAQILAADKALALAALTHLS